MLSFKQKIGTAYLKRTEVRNTKPLFDICYLEPDRVKVKWKLH